MLICEVCGNSFKNKSGLSGHRRLAHQLYSPLPSTQEASLGEFFEELFEGLEEGLENRQSVDENGTRQVVDEGTVGEWLEAITQKIANLSTHDHATCETCNIERQAAEKIGIKQTVDYYEKIKGVTELRQRHKLGQTKIRITGI